MKKYSEYALIFCAGVMLSGCGSVTDHFEYELESPGDTAEIRHYKYICVNERNGAACEYVLEKGKYLSDDIRQKYMQLGCDLGNQTSCQYLANSYPVLRQKCDVENDGESCSRLGAKYGYIGSPYDVEALLKKGCDVLNNGNTCNELAELYFDYKVNAKEDWEIRSYLDNAYEYSKKACDLDSAKGCFNYTDAYGMKTLDVKFNGSKKQKEERIRIKKEITEKACSLGHQTACLSLERKSYRD